MLYKLCVLYAHFTEETAEATESVSDGDQTPDKNKKKNRCFTCRKKVGLTGELWSYTPMTHNLHFSYMQLTVQE